MAPRQPIGEVLRGHIGLTIYAVVLMTAFNFFSHGTQDLYPNIFLGVQHVGSQQIAELIDYARKRRPEA